MTKLQEEEALRHTNRLVVAEGRVRTLRSAIASLDQAEEALETAKKRLHNFLEKVDCLHPGNAGFEYRLIELLKIVARPMPESDKYS